MLFSTSASSLSHFIFVQCVKPYTGLSISISIFNITYYLAEVTTKEKEMRMKIAWYRYGKLKQNNWNFFRSLSRITRKTCWLWLVMPLCHSAIWHFESVLCNNMDAIFPFSSSIVCVCNDWICITMPLWLYTRWHHSTDAIPHRAHLQKLLYICALLL